MALNEFEAKFYFVFNGCTDNSENVIKTYAASHDINCELLYTEKGKVRAQSAGVKKIVEECRGDKPILFADADIIFDKDAIANLYNELNRIQSLKAVGALTVPKKPKSSNLMFWILNIRNFYPLSQVSKSDVHEYKWYVHDYPQYGISPVDEEKTKIFFHGRCYMIKDYAAYSTSPDESIADDTYLSNWINYTYGPGSIRNIYGAKVWYAPYLSLREHFYTYWRIYRDLKHLDKMCPEFSKIRLKERLQLDWKYIFTLRPRVVACFVVYSMITNIERIVYGFLPRYSIEKIWKYPR